VITKEESMKFAHQLKKFLEASVQTLTHRFVPLLAIRLFIHRCRFVASKFDALVERQ